jgi:HEAT repeat protein
LKDSDPEVRRAAVEALGEIEGDAATRQLVMAMKDTDSEVRQQAAEALGHRD